MIYSRPDFKLLVDKFQKIAYVYVLHVNENEDGSETISEELIGEWDIEKIWDTIYHPSFGRKNLPLMKVGDGRVEEWIYSISQELEGSNQEIRFNKDGGYHYGEIGG